MDTINSQSETSPLTDRFSLDEIIAGLAQDLVSVRTGKMTIDAARVQAELAKQLFNGLRLVVNMQRTLEDQAKLVSPDKDEPS